MINFLNLIDENLMKSQEMAYDQLPTVVTVTVVEVPETDTSPYLPAYVVEKPHHIFNLKQRKRAAIDKRALALLTMALPNDMLLLTPLTASLLLQSSSIVSSRCRSRGSPLSTGHGAYRLPPVIVSSHFVTGHSLQSAVASSPSPVFSYYPVLLFQVGMDKNRYEINMKFLKNLAPEWRNVAVNIQLGQNLGQLGLHDIYNTMVQHEEIVTGHKTKKVDPLAHAVVPLRGSNFRSTPSHHDNYNYKDPRLKAAQGFNKFSPIGSQGENRFSRGYQQGERNDHRGNNQSNNQYSSNHQGNNGQFQGGNQFSNNQGSGQLQDNQQKGNNNRNPAPEKPVVDPAKKDGCGPTCYKCRNPGHYTNDYIKKLKDVEYFEKKDALMRKKEKCKMMMAEEENWIYEDEISYEEDQNVRGHCLMANFKGPSTTGLSEQSDDDI
ncbi:hypothetical protein OSB04_006237 [Centaurea solstitialis]|uniref:CCHC-type domain-containing protein n=1 Tax=Centaurea solstitialis TaxID=347529 RepID=A0AA38WHH4_9ASTR|nr:hypothetical protein OSB04_006237 [Centaurea solstitialis]